MILGEINLGDLLWSFVAIFFLVVYWMIFFSIIFDLFRDHSMSGVAKAAWILFLIFVPLIAMLTYVIVRGDSMAERSMQQAQKQQAAMDSYVRETAVGASPADQIAKAKELKDAGTISDQEFESLKAKALA
jgi:ABC-type cobalamin transport system permease subunit